MELPLPLLNNIGFLVSTADELISAMGEDCDKKEKDEIRRLFDLGLPPITSIKALAAMVGLSPGFLWHLKSRPEKYYRLFTIPKGKDKRRIEAPRVGLKIIQKWLSVHFEKKWSPHDAVHGFVKGRSHLTSAYHHIEAKWVISLDIENFFPSTPMEKIYKSLENLGYRTDDSLDILQALCGYENRLSQGAPTSPVLSNICLHDIDGVIVRCAEELGIKYTRYADDLVFSGQGKIREEIIEKVKSIFQDTTWNISEKKIFCAEQPARLKVHGLLVHGKKIRLTKGYRNRIRAYKYLIGKGRIGEKDIRRIHGHINYADHVENFDD